MFVVDIFFLTSVKRIGGYIVTSQCLGTGSFAKVHLAVDPTRHRQVACKSIRADKEYDVRQVRKEVRILMALRHPNINQIFGTQENDKFIHIFLQLCTGGNLFTYITSHPGPDSHLCEPEAQYVMFQLLKGLKYLHNNMISHHDLKASYEVRFQCLLIEVLIARKHSAVLCGTLSSHSDCRFRSSSTKCISRDL